MTQHSPHVIQQADQQVDRPLSQQASRPLRSDFALREVVDTHTLAQEPAPIAGISRRVFERHTAHGARTTSIVSYAAGQTDAASESAAEPVSAQGIGEELLVLSGSFTDEHGSYCAGSYLRNPAGGARRTDTGCVLFEKRGYLDPHDQARVVVDTRSGNWHPGMYAGLQNMLLAAVGPERTVLVRWAPGTRIDPHTHATVEETLVLEGELEDEFGCYPAGTWFRVPRGSTHAPYSPRGALILIKVGHIAESV